MDTRAEGSLNAAQADPPPIFLLHSPPAASPLHGEHRAVTSPSFGAVAGGLSRDPRPLRCAHELHLPRLARPPTVGSNKTPSLKLRFFPFPTRRSLCSSCLSSTCHKEGRTVLLHLDLPHNPAAGAVTTIGSNDNSSVHAELTMSPGVHVRQGSDCICPGQMLPRHALASLPSSPLKEPQCDQMQQQSAPAACCKHKVPTEQWCDCVSPTQILPRKALAFNPQGNIIEPEFGLSSSREQGTSPTDSTAEPSPAPASPAGQDSSPNTSLKLTSASPGEHGSSSFNPKVPTELLSDSVSPAQHVPCEAVINSPSSAAEALECPVLSAQRSLARGDLAVSKGSKDPTGVTGSCQTSLEFIESAALPLLRSFSGNQTEKTAPGPGKCGELNRSSAVRIWRSAECISPEQVVPHAAKSPGLWGTPCCPLSDTASPCCCQEQKAERSLGGGGVSHRRSLLLPLAPSSPEDWGSPCCPLSDTASPCCRRANKAHRRMEGALPRRRTLLATAKCPAVQNEQEGKTLQEELGQIPGEFARLPLGGFAPDVLLFSPGEEKPKGGVTLSHLVLSETAKLVTNPDAAPYEAFHALGECPLSCHSAAYAGATEMVVAPMLSKHIRPEARMPTQELPTLDVGEDHSLLLERFLKDCQRFMTTK